MITKAPHDLPLRYLLCSCPHEHNRASITLQGNRAEQQSTEQVEQLASEAQAPCLPLETRSTLKTDSSSSLVPLVLPCMMSQATTSITDRMGAMSTHKRAGAACPAALVSAVVALCPCACSSASRICANSLSFSCNCVRRSRVSVPPSFPFASLES